MPKLFEFCENCGLRYETKTALNNHQLYFCSAKDTSFSELNPPFKSYLKSIDETKLSLQRQNNIKNPRPVEIKIRNQLAEYDSLTAKTEHLTLKNESRTPAKAESANTIFDPSSPRSEPFPQKFQRLAQKSDRLSLKSEPVLQKFGILENTQRENFKISNENKQISPRKIKQVGFD